MAKDSIKNIQVLACFFCWQAYKYISAIYFSILQQVWESVQDIQVSVQVHLTVTYIWGHFGLGLDTDRLSQYLYVRKGVHSSNY